MFLGYLVLDGLLWLIAVGCFVNCCVLCLDLFCSCGIVLFSLVTIVIVGFGLCF